MRSYYDISYGVSRCATCGRPIQRGAPILVDEDDRHHLRCVREPAKRTTRAKRAAA